MTTAKIATTSKMEPLMAQATTTLVALPRYFPTRGSLAIDDNFSVISADTSGCGVELGGGMGGVDSPDALASIFSGSI